MRFRRTLAAVVLSTLPACARSPAAPSPTPSPSPTTRPSLTVTSISVLAEARTPSGFTYRATLRLQETAGVAASISSVDLTFLNGPAAVVSSHHEKPISDTANVCPSSGSVETRPLVTDDPDTSHGRATTVQATVTFTDGSAFVGRATASANVPPPAAPAPQTHTLSGVITDAATHAPIQGAKLDALNGANAGKTAVTDGAGVYTLRELVSETFRLRASADGYEPGEQNVTIPTNPQADFELRKQAHQGCPPARTVNLGPEQQEFYWNLFSECRTDFFPPASIDVTWIHVRSTHGGGQYLDLLVDANPGDARVGHITLSDHGAVYSTATFNQAAGNCVTAISPFSQSFDETGGSGTIAVTTRSACPWQATVATASSIGATITGGAQGAGNGTVAFSVGPNIEIYGKSGAVLIGIFAFQLSQSACPVSVSPLTVQAPATGALLSITVSAGRAFCRWTDYSNSPFILRSFEERTGTGAVVLTVMPNDTKQSRSGSLYVAGQTVVVNQGS